MLTETIDTCIDAFLKSDDFKEGVISSTKASWGGSCYCVELFEDGTWRVLWKNQIGNLYTSPGIIIPLPILDTEGIQEFIDAGGGDEDEFLSWIYDVDEEELKEDMLYMLHDD